MRRFVGLLLFLIFVEDSTCAYAKHIGAPMSWVADCLLAPSWIEVRGFDLAMFVVLLVAAARRNRTTRLVAPMKRALLLVLATVVLWFAYGLARGGSARFASWQTYLIASAVLVAFTVAAVCRTTSDFRGLASWLVAAAGYRAIFCWISRFTWAHGLVGETGAYLTTHDDTITWTVSIFVLLVQMIERRSRAVTLRNLAGILFFLGAIQFNSRRIAWVSLIMGLVILYFLVPSGAAKRRLNRFGSLGAVFIAAYVLVGWGRPGRAFLPLHALATISTQEDGSTLARNAENLGLITTSNYSSFIFGTGWGEPYVYLTLKYDISSFELWRYVPHNSILGLLAFTGVLGFAGFWLAIPTAVFLNARIARLSKESKTRSVGMIGVAQMIVCMNQLYGDMGIFFVKSMYVIAVSYAIALRMPRVAAVWDRPDVNSRVP